MSEPALQIAVRADESAKAAHKRLDGINGSIDRLNTKVDATADRLGAKVDVIDSKLDSVLITLATQAGAEGMKSGFLESRRFWIGIAVVLATSSTAVLLITLLTRRPS